MKNQETFQRNARIGRIVVKVGTSLLTRDGGHLDRARMARLVRELAAIRRKRGRGSSRQFWRHCRRHGGARLEKATNRTR